MAKGGVQVAGKAGGIHGLNRADVDIGGNALTAGTGGQTAAAQHHLVGDQNPTLPGGGQRAQRGSDGGIFIPDIGIRQAVAQALEAGIATEDIAEGDNKAYTTTEVGDYIAKAIN